MVSAVAVLRSSHPEPAAAVTAMAVALAVATGHRAGGVLAVGAAVAAGQLSVGWHNDWLDAERDRTAARRDKPVALGQVGRGVVGGAAATAVVAVAPLSLLSGGPAGAAHLVAVAMAWAYNARLKATLASWAPYAVAFPLLVAFVTLGAPGGRWPPWWALATAALLGCGAHLANAAPDVDADLAAGVRGLPQLLGPRRSVTGAAVLLVGGTVVVGLGPGDPSPASLAVVAVAVVVIAAAVARSRDPGSRLVFRAAMAVALVDTAALVASGAGR